MKVKPTRRPGHVLLEVAQRDEPLLEAANAAPFRLEKILVPIDFSEGSKKALQYAIPLARQHEAAITLLHVSPSLSYAGGEYGILDYSSAEAEMRSKAETELRALLKAEVGKAITAQAAVRTGTPRNDIIAFAKNLPADLIVIATHGRTGLKHVLLGSVAEHVVRYAPCPVLVVREREREFVAP